MVEYFKKKGLKDLVIVSPDSGGVERARAVGKRLNANIAIVDKRRTANNIAESMNVVGDVADKDLIIWDDIIDTGGSMVKAAEMLKEKGAKTIYACCAHPVLSGDAVSRIENSIIEELVVSNTIPIKNKGESKKIKVLSVASLLGEAIKRIHEESSVSVLFT
jgi:ribose-phosphate pyrophosphokinase